MTDSLSDWRRVEAVFSEAADLPTEARPAFLDGACRTPDGAPDTDLRRKVEGLLDADAPAAAFFDTPPPKRLERVGAWRLVDRVGRGGMGEVWRAERADGRYEQTAAVKLVRAGLAPRLEARFLAERQILARLDHPAIGRLLDGGVAEDGRPWLAMEFVEGEPITAYCDGHKLPVDDRLELFRSVCDAVQSAHRKLVVHRDLKPSNVLVTASPEGPRVKLLDFGIAKLLAEGDAAAVETGADLRMMTPEYAAPEQVAEGDITTATDVYALGVLLYELLTGRRPHAEAGGRHAIQQAILETEPLRPSDAVTHATTGHPATRPPSEQTGAGSLRATSPERLRRRLRGDLDRIVMKALRKEPERRYESAAALGADVRRHLRGLPIEARPHTVGYRASRFARRHRAGVAVAALSFVLVLGAAGVALREADRASAERDRAVRATTLLTDLLGDVDPDETGGRQVAAVDLLDRTSARLRSGLRDDPWTRASVEAAVGKVYGNLGLFDRAEALQRDALRIRVELGGAGHPEALESAADLATLLTQSSRYAEGEAVLDHALARGVEALGPSAPAVSVVRRAMGLNLVHQGRFADAEPHLRRALADVERKLGPDHVETAHAHAAMGALLRRQGRLTEAEAAYQRAAGLYRAHYGPESARLGSVLNELGVVVKNQGDYLRGQTYYRQALGIFEETYGETHPETALAQGNLALVYKDRALLTGDEALLQRAAPLLDRSLTTFRRLHGDDHLRVAHTEAHLGMLALAEGDAVAAEGWFRRSLATHDVARTPAMHSARPYPLTGLGTSLVHTGRAAEAVPVLREALRIREVSTPGHWRIAEAQSALAEAYTALGQTLRADSLLSLAEARIARGGGEFGPLTILTRQRRAALAARGG
jgi:serine/threonine-protein kinase